jgi:hypothetical protein
MSIFQVDLNLKYIMHGSRGPLNTQNPASTQTW